MDTRQRWCVATQLCQPTLQPFLIVPSAIRWYLLAFTLRALPQHLPTLACGSVALTWKPVLAEDSHLSYPGPFCQPLFTWLEALNMVFSVSLSQDKIVSTSGGRPGEQTLQKFGDLFLFYPHECLLACIMCIACVPSEGRNGCQIAWNWSYGWLDVSCCVGAGN